VVIPIDQIFRQIDDIRQFWEEKVSEYEERFKDSPHLVDITIELKPDGEKFRQLIQGYVDLGHYPVQITSADDCVENMTTPLGGGE